MIELTHEAVCHVAGGANKVAGYAGEIIAGATVGGLACGANAPTVPF